MSNKFTIKFKGILDHAATKKAIEQDISKMEKYLNPKKSSLGSTKYIVKNNLSDKKKELNRQSKFESLRERVEKHRLTQAKKLIKQSVGFEKSKQKELQFLNSTVYNKEERNKIWGALKGMKGFERDLEKEDFLRTAIMLLKGPLRKLKLNDKEGENVVNSAKLAAVLRSVGFASNNESAVGAVSQILKGNFTEAFNLLKPIDKFREKHLEAIKDKLEPRTKEGRELHPRPQAIVDVINDILSLKILGYSNEVQKAKSDLANIEQTFQNLTNDVLQPIISKVSTIIDTIIKFNFKKILDDIVGSIKEAISSAFAGLKTVGSTAINTANTVFGYINPLSYLGGFFSKENGDNDQLGKFK